MVKNISSIQSHIRMIMFGNRLYSFVVKSGNKNSMILMYKICYLISIKRDLYLILYIVLREIVHHNQYIHLLKSIIIEEIHHFNNIVNHNSKIIINSKIFHSNRFIFNTKHLNSNINPKTIYNSIHT